MARNPRVDSRHSTGPASAVKRRLQVHRQVARTSLQRLLAQPGSSLLTIFVIAVSLLLPSLLFLLNANLNQLLLEFRQDTRITLYLTDGINEVEGLQVSEDLLLWDDVSAVSFISSAQGLAEFSESSGLGDVLAQLPTNPLPATILVTPASEDPVLVSALATALGQHKDVTLVQVDSQWLQRLAAVSRLITALGTGLTVIVVLGLFLIVGNTIKLSIENRHREISVIKLVGGTDAFIARPFLYSGLYFGSAGGIFAVILQLVVLTMVNRPLQELLSLYDSGFDLQSFDPVGAGQVIVAGAVIGWAAALLASLRHIRSLDP